VTIVTEIIKSKRSVGKNFRYEKSQSSKSSGGETQAKFAHHVTFDTQEEPCQCWSGDYAFHFYSFFSKVKKLYGIADSGATGYMLNRRWCFINYLPVKAGTSPVSGIGKDCQLLKVAGFGDVYWK
jgi:hypothetical protein